MQNNTAELQQQIDELIRERDALRVDRARLSSILANLQDSIIWSQAPDTGAVLYLSPTVESIYGYAPEAFLADNDLWLKMLHPDDIAIVEAFFPQILRDGIAEVEYRVRRPDGTIRWLHDRGYVVRDPETGEVLRLDGIATDITAQRHIAEAEETIRAQAETIRELSMPVIPIADDVILLPLIGAINEERSAQISSTLLEGIDLHHANVAIIDITGLSIIDTQTANALVNSARAARLLGTRIFLTGIRPEVAQTLVALGLALPDLQTFATLQRGIQVALSQRSHERG